MFSQDSWVLYGAQNIEGQSWKQGDQLIQVGRQILNKYNIYVAY